MDWNQIKRFCFTYAIMGGAWLEDALGHREWCSESQITAHFGHDWYRRQIQRHGIFTGCWIDVA